MKILTKKKQKRLMFDLIDIFLMGSDALKAVGTRQPMDPAQALQRQMKMIDAAMDAANIIRGFYGNRLLMEANKQWQQLEQQHGFPLKLKDERQGGQDVKEALDTIAGLDIELVEQYSAQDYDRWRRAVQTLQRFLQPILTDRKPNE